MPRWPADSRERLAHSAIALFAEHGYTTVTVDDIAARAGVTPRTFFRHFRDKEEVLFAQDDELLPALLAAIAEPPGPVAADELMRHALGTLAELMQRDADALRRRHRIIASDVALTGRELAKQAHWQPRIADALAERGFDPDDAAMLAAIGFAVFRRAYDAWARDGAADPLPRLVDDAMQSIGGVLSSRSTR